MTNGRHQKLELAKKFLNLCFDIGNIEGLTAQFNYDSDIDDIEVNIYDKHDAEHYHRHFLLNNSMDVNEAIRFLNEFLENN